MHRFTSVAEQPHLEECPGKLRGHCDPLSSETPATSQPCFTDARLRNVTDQVQDLKKNTEQFTEMRKNLRSMMDTMQEKILCQDKRIKELACENAKLRSQLDTTTLSLTMLTDRIIKLPDREEQQMLITKRVEELQITLTMMMLHINLSQNRKIEGQACDIAKLKSQVEKPNSCLAIGKGPSSHTQLHREEFPSTTGYSTQNYPTSEPSNVDGKLMQVMKSVEELQRTTSMMKVHISELELQLQASLASTHTGSFLWRIPEVARRKRDAFDGRITSIYSPPFYSGQNGYKMCIRAYLNGDGIGFNTHLSVFFVLMRGEYDPLLKWPFESKVSLILVDQNLRQHIVQTFKPSPESSSFQKPRSDMNVASGCPQFAKLSVLEEGNYVKDDVMFLKCIVDTAKSPTRNMRDIVQSNS